MISVRTGTAAPRRTKLPVCDETRVLVAECILPPSACMPLLNDEIIAVAVVHALYPGTHSAVDSGSGIGGGFPPLKEN
jgi:hypothetical protein